MLISSPLVMMNYNLCNRLKCCLKLRFCYSSRTFLSKCGTHNILPLRWDFPKKINISSQKSSGESLEETGAVEEYSIASSKDILMDEYSEQFRNTLYPDSEDPLLLQIKSCDSIKELFTIINENQKSFTSSHYCQVLLVFFDILHINNCLIYGTNLAKIPESIANELPEPVSSIALNIIDSLKSDIEKLNPDELVCCLLYSKRLGVDVKHPSAQVFLMKIDNLLSKDADLFPISALSRLTITFNDRSELWTRLFYIKTLPLIYYHFDKCQSLEDFRALTISMLSTVQYLREELLIKYVALTEEFLRRNLLMREHRSVIVKAVMLLNNIYHIPAARKLIYKLLQTQHGHLDKLFVPHLLDLRRIVIHQVEPRNTLMELKEFKKSSLFSPTIDDEVLHAYLSFLELPMDNKGKQKMKDMIAKSDNMETLQNMQVHLTTAVPDVCNLYWSKMAELLQPLAPRDTFTLITVCLKYMHFSYRMLSYHHRQFESVALMLIARELVDGTSVLQPQVLAFLTSFVLAMDTSRGAASLSRDVLTRLLAAIGQLNMQSCMMVSRGLGERMHKSRDIHILAQVDTALNKRVRELLESEDPASLKNYNAIFRSCVYRKQSIESDLMKDILKRLQKLDWSQLTSRSLRNMVYNLQITNTLISPVIEKLVEYCVTNSAYVMVDTPGKLLHLCYHLGYAPKHINSLCNLTADLVVRDGEMLNGLSLLQVSLALSYFNHLPSSLIRAIFTVDFLEKLDDEIKQCYAKNKYPLRVRQTLMELNRSVCLDHPEADIPWFHSKFCEEQKALGQLEVVPRSLLFTDVYSTLLKLVVDAEYIVTRAFTPYGYILDLQLNLDASKNPMPFKNSENIAHKLALLLHYGDSYTVFEQRLKGYHEMKKRHLEILGYRVISLSDQLWNAMFMAEPKVKQEYLQNLLWSS